MARSRRPRNNALCNWLRRLGGEARGATAIEYGFILALVALSLIVSLVELADTTTGIWNNVNAKVTKAS